jgi:hypothetical protein
MQVRHGSEFLKFAALAAGFVASASLATAQQAAPAPQQAPPAPSIPLQTYTASDTSATVGVPAGWKVTKAVYGIIQVSGPNGELISLGNTLIVHNGTQPNQSTMTLPNQATITQKAEAVWKMGIAASGDTTASVKLISATPIPLGNIAQCGIFLGSQSGAKGAAEWEMRFCSLPMDTNGIYKLFWLDAIIPASLAAQERATAEAVLSSYRPSTPTLENLLKPETPPLPPMGYSAPSGAPGVSPTDYGEVEAQHTADCMDEGVLREEPAWQLPPYCR